MNKWKDSYIRSKRFEENFVNCTRCGFPHNGIHNECDHCRNIIEEITSY